MEIKKVEHKDSFRKAWNCLLPSYQKHAEEIAKKKGIGISVYKLLKHPRRDGTNCEFWYADYKSREWYRILKLTGHTDPGANEKEYFICIQIPVGERGDYYVSDMKSFTFDKTIRVIQEKPNSQDNIRRRKNKDIKDIQKRY